MRLLPLLSCSILLMFISACTYDKTELTPIPSNEFTGTPTVTYTNYVANVINTNCTGCHSPSGTNQMPYLTTYSEVKTAADNGRIKARAIDGIPTFMPPSGALPQSVRDSLQLWLDQGAAQ